MFLLVSYRDTHTHKQILILQVYFLLQAGTLVFRSHSRAVNAPSLSVPIHLGSSCQTDTLIHFSLPGKKTSKKLRNETDRETARLVNERAPSKHRGTCVRINLSFLFFTCEAHSTQPCVCSILKRQTSSSAQTLS